MSRLLLPTSVAIGLLLSLQLHLAVAAGAESLMDIYRDARSNDPQLNAARAARDAGKEVWPQALAAVFPQASGRLSWQRNKQDVSESVGFSPPRVSRFSSNSISVSLSQVLFDWSAFNNLRVAHRQAALAELDLRIAEQALIQRVAGAYFDVLAAQDANRFAGAERRAIERQMEQAQRRFELGAAAIVDVHETRARADLARASEIEAGFRLRSAGRSLQAIIGRAHQALMAPPLDVALADPDPADAQQWADTARQNNLSLLKARATAEAAERQIARQTGGHVPSLSLVGNYRDSDTTDDEFVGNLTRDSSIGLQLDVPLSEGGAVLSRVREAEARWLQRSAELEAQRRTTRQDSLDAYDAALASKARVEALRQALISNETALKTVEAGFRLGARSGVDVLDAQQLYYRAQSDLSRALYDYYLQILRLKGSTGQLGAEDLQEISLLLQAPPSDTSAVRQDSPENPAVAPAAPASAPVPRDDAPAAADLPPASPDAAPAP